MVTLSFLKIAILLAGICLAAALIVYYKIQSKKRYLLRKTSDLATAGEEAVISEMYDTLSLYHWMASTLHGFYVILGIIAILSSVFVTTFLATKRFENEIPFISFTGTTTLTLITAFNLGAKSNNARKAWRHLNNAMLEFKVKKITIEELITAKNEAENILGGVDFQYSTN